MRRMPDAEVPPTPRTTAVEDSRPRARWERPRLVDHGDVRELTLGTTQGVVESGAPFARRV